MTSALLVITAILPLVPSYLSGYLPDLFEIFTELATIRQTKRLGRVGRREGGKERGRGREGGKERGGKERGGGKESIWGCLGIVGTREHGSDIGGGGFYVSHRWAGNPHLTWSF